MQKASQLFWVLLLGACTLAAAQQNLVNNPSFEEPATTNRLPAGGWWLYQAQGETEARVDPSVAHTGKASLRLQSRAPSKSVLANAPFPVTPGDQLTFRAWARAEKTAPETARAYAGFAFRNANRQVFEHAYFSTKGVRTGWKLIAGAAKVPEEATTAEVHLGYTNAPGALWYDDVSATVTNLLSFSLLAGAKPWPGPQDLSFLILNRATNQFRGSLSATVGGKTQTVPVLIEAETNSQVKLPIALAGTGLHKYSITLSDSAGLPIRVLQGKFLIQRPLVLYPACPCYHAAEIGDGKTRIDARINLSPIQRSGLQFCVEVLDGTRNQLDSASTDASAGDTVGLNVRIPVGKPASFRVNARLIDSAGKEIARAKTDVKVGAAEEARVLVGADGFLRVAGDPSFPIGLYSSGREAEMGKAGFTATHNYGITTGNPAQPINPNDTHLQELLDRALANSLRMMVELPRRSIETAEWTQVRRRIETFRYHPGLLCWGSEERVARGTAPLTNIATLHRLVHELDPNHPLVLGDTRDVITKFQIDRRQFFPDPYMDIGIWWWYPIPLTGPDGNGLDGQPKSQGSLEPPSWLTATESKRPLWIAIQSYQQPRRDARFPTPAEYRCMAYLSILNGVKGLWFYTGSGQKDYQGKPAGLLNRPEEGHWGYVQELVRELRTLSPVVMAPACPAKLSISPAHAPLQYTLRELEGRLYLLAANKSLRPQTVRFNGSALSAKRVQVLFESHAVVIQGDSLPDEFAPLGVHVYRLE
jgi:hypothetical protein